MQKNLDKIQHPIMIKTLSKLRIEGNFPNFQVLGRGALGRPRGIGWRGRWEGDRDGEHM